MNSVLVVSTNLDQHSSLILELEKRFDFVFKNDVLENLKSDYSFIFIDYDIVDNNYQMFLKRDNEKTVVITKFESNLINDKLKKELGIDKILPMNFEKFQLVDILHNYANYHKDQDIINYLKEQGFSTKLKGFHYLARLITIIIHEDEDPKQTMRLYKKVSLRYNASYMNVEKAIRYLVNKHNQDYKRSYTNSEVINEVVAHFNKRV